MDEIASIWKTLLISCVKTFPEDAALALSGGMDSSSVLAALLEIGRRPPIYHFVIKGHKSKDYKNTLKIVKEYNLELRLVEVEETPETLIQDVYKTIEIIQAAYKTAVQCSHPFMYVCEDLCSRNEKFLIQANPGIVEESRKASILFSRNKLDELQEFRVSMSKAPGNGYYGTLGEYSTFNHYGITVLEPFRDKRLVEYSLSLPVAEINTPVQKGIALRAFPEFYSLDIWKKNADSQIESGFAEWHDSLIVGTKHKKVVGFYNSIIREMFPNNIKFMGGGVLAANSSPIIPMLEGQDWPRKGKKNLKI